MEQQQRPQFNFMLKLICIALKFMANCTIESDLSLQAPVSMIIKILASPSPLKTSLSAMISLCVLWSAAYVQPPVEISVKMAHSHRLYKNNEIFFFLFAQWGASELKLTGPMWYFTVHGQLGNLYCWTLHYYSFLLPLHTVMVYLLSKSSHAVPPFPRLLQYLKVLPSCLNVPNPYVLAII